jgi:hypothetical protein
MKLLLCLDCHDVLKFGTPMQWRACQCGHSSGRYLSDGVSAEFKGDNARAIGIDNRTIEQAVRSLLRAPDRDDFAAFPRVDAWVFPRGHYRIRHVTPPDLTETSWDDEPFPLP